MEKLVMLKNGDTLEIRSQEGIKIATVHNVQSFRRFCFGYAAIEFITKRYAATGKPCEFRWGFIDTEGNVVVEPKYIFASNVNKHGNAFVKFCQFGGEVIKIEK